MVLMSDEESIAALQSLSKEQKQFLISKQQLLSSAEVILTYYNIRIKRFTNINQRKRKQKGGNSESETKDKENGIDNTSSTKLIKFEIIMVVVMEKTSFKTLVML